MLATLAAWPALQTLRLVSGDIYKSSPMTTPTDGWPQLSTFAMHNLTFTTPSNVVQLIQQLSTSRCLTSVDLSFTELGTAGFAALAKALPAWMARRLETLVLTWTGLRDDDVEPFARALASGKNRRHLKVDLGSNLLSVASIKLLLGALSACRNVTLHVETNHDEDFESLVKLHKLRQWRLGDFMAPLQTSSPRQSM